MSRTKEGEMAKRLNLFPCTGREFKSCKRQQLKMIKASFEDYRAGCAASPAYKYVRQVGLLLDEMEREQSVQKWGR